MWLHGLTTGLQTKKVASSIPSQGTCLDYEPGPQLGVIDISLCLFLLSSPLSKKINIFLKSFNKGIKERSLLAVMYLKG